MLKLLLFPLLLVGASTRSYCNKANLKLYIPKKGVSNALYKHVVYLDSRTDSSGMGVVQTGLFPTDTEVTWDEPMPVQLDNLINRLTAESASKDTGLFQLRYLKFYQRPGYFSNKGYCLLKANFYAQRNGRYFPVGCIDTLITVKTMTMDGIPVVNAGGKAITNFISNKLTISPEANAEDLSYATLEQIDNYEKQKLPLYAKDTFTDGVYLTWEAFKKQQPNFINELSMVQKNEKVESVEFADTSAVIHTAPPDELYAVVYQKRAYLAGKNGFYPLRRQHGDFTFTSKEKEYAGFGETVVARQLLGPFSFLYELNQKGNYEVKIDHSNGQFVRIKKVE